MVHEDGSGVETHCRGSVHECSEPRVGAQRIQPTVMQESMVAVVPFVECQRQMLQSWFRIVQPGQNSSPEKSHLRVSAVIRGQLKESVEGFQTHLAVTFE